MRLKLKQLSSPESSSGKLVTVERNKLVGFSQRSTKINPTVGMKFDSKLGELIFIKENGDTLVAEGFLTLDKVGRGKRGERGDKGRKGRNGKNGRDGKKGDDGCQGERGEKGDKGKAGRDGEHGEDGIVGNSGCPGIIGDKGERGEKGDKGFQGEKGRKGISCIVGVIGPIGPKGNGNTFVGKSAPTGNYVLWGDNGSGETEDAELNFSLNQINQLLTKESGTTFTGSGILVPTDITGLKGQAIFQWEGSYSSDSRIAALISLDKKNLELNTSVQIPEEQTKSVEGVIKLTLIDSETNEKVSKETRYKFYATNSDKALILAYAKIGQDQTLVEGDTIVEKIEFHDADGSAVPLSEDTLLTFRLTGDTDILKDQTLEFNRVVPKDSTFYDISFETNSLSGNQSLKTIQLQVTGLAEAVAGDLRASYSIGNVQEAERKLVYSKEVTIRQIEGEYDKFDIHDIEISLDSPWTSDQQGYASATLVSDTAIVGDVSNNVNYENDQTFIDVESNAISQTFTKTSSDKMILSLEVMRDKHKQGDRYCWLRWDTSSLSGVTVDGDIKIIIKDQSTSSGGGGGGGCIWEESLVKTPEGLIEAKYLTVGDKLVGTNIKDMPDATTFGLSYLEWETRDFVSKTEEVSIQGIAFDTYHKYLIINDLKVTHDHPVLVRREGVVKWQRAEKVLTSDLVYDGYWKRVNRIVERFENIKVVNFDVEPYDTYFANGILLHNSEQSKV